MTFGPLDLVIHLKNLCWENDLPIKNTPTEWFVGTVL